MHRASITSDILSSTQQRINLIIIWYQLFLKLIQLKISTLCQILGIGIRQKQPQILGTRQNLILGSAPEKMRFPMCRPALKGLNHEQNYTLIPFNSLLFPTKHVVHTLQSMTYTISTY